MATISVTVDEFTTPDPVTANEEMAVEELRELMAAHGVRHLPVVRDDAVVGIVSDRDVRMVLGLPIQQEQQVCAADIMAAEPLTVTASTPLDQVAYLMSDRKIGSVIVNDEEDRFLGIFTASDALNALVEIVREGGPPAA